MRMHNLHGTEKEKEEEESSDESDDEKEDEDKKPQMELVMMPHYGGINRVRVCWHLYKLIHSVLDFFFPFLPVTDLVSFIPGDTERRTVTGCCLVWKGTGGNIWSPTSGGGRPQFCCNGSFHQTGEGSYTSLHFLRTHDRRVCSWLVTYSTWYMSLLPATCRQNKTCILSALVVTWVTTICCVL